MTRHQDEMNYERSLVDKVDFATLEPVTIHSNHAVYLVPRMGAGFFYVDHDNERVAMGRESWATLSHDMTALYALLTDMAKGTAGMRFVNVDTNADLRRAARREASDLRMDVIHAKDELTILTEKCELLIVKVVGLGKAPTALQLNIFHRDYAEIREEFEKIRKRMTHLQGIIEVAGIKIATAA